MSKKCGMGCDAPARHGGFYCEACHSRWDREIETARRKKVEAAQARQIQALRDEVAELKGQIKGRKP